MVERSRRVTTAVHVPTIGVGCDACGISPSQNFLTNVATLKFFEPFPVASCTLSTLEALRLLFLEISTSRALTLYSSAKSSVKRRVPRNEIELIEALLERRSIV
jgi:hypothetical protein